MGLIWAVSLLVVLAGGAWLERGPAALVFVAAASLFAVGECLHGATQGPIVADLAPPQLVGRYMAVSSLTWQVAFIVGPAGGGFLLQHAPLLLWPIGSAICLVGGVWALALESTMPEATRIGPGGVAAGGIPAG